MALEPSNHRMPAFLPAFSTKRVRTADGASSKKMHDARGLNCTCGNVDKLRISHACSPSLSCFLLSYSWFYLRSTDRGPLITHWRRTVPFKTACS